MSKQHQASRRHTYGRRQHELHQRTERPIRFLGWLEVRGVGEVADRFGSDRFDLTDARVRFVAQSVD
ncbi:MAG TPA: hypothetical protein VFC12_02600 [Terriglobales bacterium]|nr:hypothetical protein [Terriglobales bacterium]